MSGESTQSLLTNPFVIVIALVVVAVLVGLVVYLILRARPGKGQGEEHLQSRLLEMEREHQFAAAADQMPYFKDAATAGKETAVLFREYLSMPVLAIYAGREGEAKHSNILSKGADAVEKQTDSLLLKSMPAYIAASSVSRYWGPQVEKLSAFNGGIPLATGHEQAGGGESQTTSEAPVTAPLDDAPRRDEGVAVNNPRGASPDLDIIVLPWRGPFDWHGLIVARMLEAVNTEAFGRLREPLARVSDRLSVALQFQQDSAQMVALDERASRSLDFSSALFASLEEPSPLASIAREVTTLIGADSGALWRVEPSASMVRMVAAHGLKSAEFLPLPIGQGLAGSVAQSGESLALEDAPSDPRCIFPREARESGIGSYLGAPIFSDGKTIGVVEVHTAQPRQWTEADMRSLKSAALIIAEFFKSADVRGNRLRVESAYLGLSEALQRLRAPDELMEAVVEVLGHALGVSRVVVAQFDNNGQPLPINKEYAAESVKSALGATFTGELAGRFAQSAEGGPVAIVDSRKDSLIGAEKAAELQILSELAVPVRIEGRTRAVLYLHQCDHTREWQRDEIEFADRVARQLSLSLSNLRSFEAVSRSAQAARDEARRTGGDAATRLREVEQKLAELERAASDARNSETQARAALAKTSAAEAKARAEAEVVRRAETELRHERDRLHDNYTRVEASAQQLLEINRLKSEFIVNAGREIEAALQPVLGLAELLERGSYGPLNAEQREAVRGIYASAKRIKGDVDWLIEYGSTRSRRLDEGEPTKG
ncbi:MAG TPA: GAF domain-containing protein [Blastocatellia bacterium]|nr:GAF domain-containing protein [Blastocatellia bacterium]